MRPMRELGVSARVSATRTLLKREGAAIWYHVFAFHLSLVLRVVVRARALAILITTQ